MGSRPAGSTGRRLGGSEVEGGRSGEPLTEVVEQQLARLPDIPLADHPRVYEDLDAAVRETLETHTGDPPSGTEAAAEPPETGTEPRA